MVKRNKKALLPLCALVLLVGAGCAEKQQKTAGGAAVGGMLGAAVGGIAAQGAGAAIGGGLGAAVGAAVMGTSSSECSRCGKKECLCKKCLTCGQKDCVCVKK